MAAYSKAPLNIIKMLYTAYPEAIKLKNKHGNLPLHYILHNNAKPSFKSTTKFLLSKYPQAIAELSSLLKKALYNIVPLSSLPTQIQQIINVTEENTKLKKQVNNLKRKYETVICINAETGNEETISYKRRKGTSPAGTTGGGSSSSTGGGSSSSSGQTVLQSFVKIKKEKNALTSKISNYLECPVCKESFENTNKKPLTLSCSHTFCQNCWNNWKAQPIAQNRCPTCKQVVVGTPTEARLVKQMAADLLSK